MKTAFACFSATLAAAGLALAAPAAAQDYLVSGGVGPAYDGAFEYDVPVPPRVVPHYRSRTETVVTTTRRIITHGDDEAAFTPRTVVTTRRLVTSPAPVYAEPIDVVTTGSVARPLPPPPPRRIVKDVTFAPAPAHVVSRRPPVVIEERRVETTRRIIGPAPADWE